MSEVVAGESPLSNVGTVVFDLDGVVYIDGRGVPGAGVALRALVDAGMHVLFATNNSTRTRRAVIEHIAQITGFRGHPGQVVNSSLVTARAIAGRYRRALVVGEQGLADTLAAEGIDVVEDWRRADVVVAGLNRDLTYQDLAAATLAIRGNGAGFVATNTDVTYPTADGLVPGAGAVVAAIAAASGRQPEDFGKPHEAFRGLVRELAVGRVLMVGDRPDTDIAMGKAEGWATALVLTGVVSSPDGIDPAYRPDVVLPSIAALPAALGLATS